MDPVWLTGTQYKIEPGSHGRPGVQSHMLCSQKNHKQTTLRTSDSAKNSVTELRSGCLLLESQYLKKRCLQERKVCFIQENNSLGRKQTLCPKANSLLTDQGEEILMRSFRGISGGRGLHAETSQSACTIILKLVIQWSDQCHLDCFKYSQSSVPGLVCSHFLEASSWN